MRDIEESVAVAAVEWFSEADGGRSSGRPTGPVYGAPILSVDTVILIMEGARPVGRAVFTAVL